MAQVLVFGLPHDRLGEEVAAAVVPRNGRTLDVDALRKFLAEHLAPFKIPSHIAFYAEQLPRNPAGKILKRALRDEIVAGR